uniref:Uncharacterized protein n=1 Tax=Anguilla anguilla TaxID=7936 RepID=A0A0E9SZ56_ANGAN
MANNFSKKSGTASQNGMQHYWR